MLAGVRVPLRPALVGVSALWACVSQSLPVGGPKSSADDATAFRDVLIFDGSRALGRGDVLVRSGTIAAVGERLTIPSGAAVIEGSGDTLLPGLIDSHAHVWKEDQLEQALVFGNTTVLDMAMAAKTAASLRAKVASAAGIRLADLRSAGNGATATGGHLTEYGYPLRTIDDPSQAKQFVDACIAEGSDYIKAIYDPRQSRFKSMSVDTLAAIVVAAHSRNKLVVAHIEKIDDAREAIDVGVDGLAHMFEGVSIDPPFFELIVARKTFVIPTLSLLQSEVGQAPGEGLAIDSDLAPALSQQALSELRASFERHKTFDFSFVLRGVSELKARGIRILAGTDAPNPGTTFGASLHGEIELLHQAGLTNEEALAAATSVPAAAFGLKDRGRIAPGLRADLLLVHGDPTSDLGATRRIAGVWRQGIPVDLKAYRNAHSREQ
jgi:imidazolonepropionase-like amidohydrolase